MSNLLAQLRSSGDALAVFENTLNVSQNNVANASTPGYVKQSVVLQAAPFDGSGDLGGGVSGNQVQSARDVYSEAAVQHSQTSLGQWTQQLAALSNLQGSFDVSGTTGIPGALSQLYSAFSTWAASPGDPTAQQGVLSAAQSLAGAFQDASAAVNQAKTGADSQLSGLVGQVNTLAGQIQQDNVKRMSGSAQDPSVDADLYNNLEQLSQIVPITTLQQANGSMTVLMDGQTPLVVGASQFQLSAPAGSLTGGATVLDSNGTDITSQITGGEMGGLLQARNGVLASLGGDSTQQGGLNQLAQAVADRVNGLLTSGNINTGPPAISGSPIFTYTAASPNTIAQSIAVDPSVQPDQLAAIDPGPPEVSNGTALKLANLATPQSPAAEINGLSYAQFYGQVAATLGTAVSTAQTNQTVEQAALTQAQNLRQQTSGVSLDEEAINVLQFQRSYQAISKMVEVLDQVTQTAVSLIP